MSVCEEESNQQIDWEKEFEKESNNIVDDDASMNSTAIESCDEDSITTQSSRTRTSSLCSKQNIENTIKHTYRGMRRRQSAETRKRLNSERRKERRRTSEEVRMREKANREASINKNRESYNQYQKEYKKNMRNNNEIRGKAWI